MACVVWHFHFRKLVNHVILNGAESTFVICVSNAHALWVAEAGTNENSKYFRSVWKDWTVFEIKKAWIKVPSSSLGAQFVRTSY